MMRVLHVHSGNLFGGVETFLLTLARHSEGGLRSEFALCFEGRFSRELAAESHRVHTLGEVRARNPHSVIRARRALRKLLREREYDVAFFHSPWALALFSTTVRGAGLPVAFYLHGAASCRDLLERWARRTPPDLVFCSSEYTRGTLPVLFPGARSELVRYPVEDRSAALAAEERATIRRALDTPADATVVVQVSRMEPWKGHELHLDALARLRDEPGWICWQAGGAQRPSEAEYLAGLRRRAAEQGVADRIRFLGERRDVPALLRAADIHCQPNLGPEPFGITFIEALYAGLPVVTTAIGAAVEIVTPECGILVPPEAPDALADALRDLVRHPETRARLGAAGPARAAQLCDPPRQVERLRSCLATLPPGE